MNIFERASRNKTRFTSPVGQLSVEQLWDLPLVGKTDKQISLDGLARSVNHELRSIAEGSFVEVVPDPRKTELTLQLDILKHIIEVKLDAQAAAKRAAETAQQKQKLLSALAAKQEAKLGEMTEEQIKAELEKLG